MFKDEVGDFTLVGGLILFNSSLLVVKGVGLKERVDLGLKDRVDGLDVEFVKTVVLFVCEGEVDFRGTFLKFLRSLINDLLGFEVG